MSLERPEVPRRMVMAEPVQPALQMASSDFVRMKEDSVALRGVRNGSFSRFLCCSSVANPDSRPPRAVDSEKIPRSEDTSCKPDYTRNSKETAEDADEGFVGFTVDGRGGDADAPCGTVFHEPGDGVFGSAWGDLDGEDAVSGP